MWWQPKQKPTKMTTTITYQENTNGDLEYKVTGENIRTKATPSQSQGFFSYLRNYVSASDGEVFTLELTTTGKQVLVKLTSNTSGEFQAAFIGVCGKMEII